MSSVFIKIGAVTYNTADWTAPAERIFRDAWEATGADTGVIGINMEKAKELWREKIRQARIEPLAALDTAYMKALETGAETTQIIAEKQALRDAPADAGIDAATTPEELAAVQPAGLKVE